MLASLLTLALVVGSAGLALQQYYSAQQLRELRSRLQRLEQWQRESARIAAQIEQLQQVQKLAETSVNLGAETVRTLHLGIAAIPFGILEAIPVTRDTTRIVRALHDQISDVVYGSIVGSNRVLGSVIRHGIARDAKAGDVRKIGDTKTAIDPPEDAAGS